MLRYIVMIVGLLVVVIAVVVIVGSSLPVTHTVTREATYVATPVELFALIRNVGEYSSWQKSVSRVEALADVDGKPRFRETNSGQAITYELSDIVADRKMVSRIADERLPFGGSWTYEIVDSSLPSTHEGKNATTLRITENGEVTTPSSASCLDM